MPAHKEGRQDWETPEWVFQHWNGLFDFTVDVCATHENYKGEGTYFTIEDDGLGQDWFRKCWMNPPYGRGEVQKWVKKAYEESLKGCLVCALLPVSTSSKWWQTYVTKADLIYFYPKRIKFVGASGSPSFDNAIVIWGLTQPATSAEQEKDDE